MKCKSRKLASRDCEKRESIRCEILEKYILEELNKQLDIYYSLDELEKNYILQKKTLLQIRYVPILTVISGKRYTEMNWQS